MQAQPLDNGMTMPLAVEPGGEVEPSRAALSAWAADSRDVLDGWLHQAGALLLRGFRIDGAREFRAVAEAISPALREYVGGDSPRTSVAERVYTSTEFPAELEIGLHNELSYAGWWPQRVFFCCLVAAQSGGETHIADSRKVYTCLDPTVRERFADKGVTYLQHLHDADGESGPGKSWQDTFETTNRTAVERICREQGMEFLWTARGLRTAMRNPGVVTHPLTGETCWFNQADLWHASFDTVKPRERTAPSSVGSEDLLGSHACYGDGSEIPIEDLQAVRAAYRASEVAFPWQPGDLLMLDNILAMHGRKPFRGERRVLVAMA